MKFNSLIVRSILVPSFLCTILGSSTLSMAAVRQTFYGSQAPQQVAVNPNQPVPRGYIVPSATPIPGGARIHVQIYQDRLNAPVGLWLQMAVNDGNPKAPFPGMAVVDEMRVIGLRQLSPEISDNPTNYYSERTYDLNYDEINKQLEALAPNAPGVRIGPGSPLFVYARFENGTSNAHQWGGVARGGIVFMPEDSKTLAKPDGGVSTQRPSELDIAYPIQGGFAAKFNENGKGLKLGGQIRSRVETEGKYQIPLEKLDSVKQAFFDLANDPSKVSALLGPDWSIHAELRYMKKDSAGQMIKDENNLPIPDPMVDTYYDNENFDAAKSDMAIRYRWTEGNKTGSWNFKPGLTKNSGEGIVDRIEYGVDTTDDKPETVAKFADSMDPLNPFRLIRSVLPGIEPSSLLKPSIRLTDTRYKFLMKHKSGLIIEASIDDVHAHSLRGDGKQGRFAQVEMDVDHLGTTSTNVAQQNSSLLQHNDPTFDQGWLSRLDGRATLEGRPVIHDMRDLEDNSPVKVTHVNDFLLANEAIVNLRNATMGTEWLPGPQKYALAASSLKLARGKQPESVRTLRERRKELDITDQPVFSLINIANCGGVFE